MNSIRFKFLYGLVAVLIVVVVVLSFFVWKGSPRTVMPQQLVGLSLVRLTQGEEAKVAIDRMHGTDIKIKEGYIAMYGGTAGNATLWVSESENQAEARHLLNLMTEKIKDGNEFFSNLQSHKEGKFTVYSVEGGRQIHYYYGTSNKTVWLSADPLIAYQALKEVLSKVR